MDQRSPGVKNRDQIGKVAIRSILNNDDMERLPSINELSDVAKVAQDGPEWDNHDE